MVRPFYLKGGSVIGWLAIIMGLGIGVLYMPGMPSVLIWPYEWIIIIIWLILGIVFYKMTMTKESTKFTDEHLNREISSVIKYHK